MTLLMRDQENQEIGEERGRREGRLEGMREGRLEGRLEGRREGQLEGEVRKLVSLIRKKQLRGYPKEQIADLLEEEKISRMILLSRKLNDALSSRLFYAHFDSHRDISHFKSSCFCELFF